MSPAILYLAIGAVAGPLGLRFIAPDLALHGRHIEAATEVVLLVALFAAGLRVRPKLEWSVWRKPLRFAVLTPIATMLLIAITAQICFGLDLTAALLLGAILAPTDLALTAEVRLPSGAEESDVRTWLTAESVVAMMFAVPLVLLVLGLRGTHDIGHDGLMWMVLDLAWPIAGGLAIGWGTGVLVWRFVARSTSARDAELPDELVAVGAIAAACGLAMLLSAYALCAVFAAGLALSHAGNRRNEGRTDRPSARFQSFAARLERFATVAALLLLGALVSLYAVRPATIVFALLLLTVVRPLAARLGLASSGFPPEQARAASWFGMRGIVSLYLLAVAVNQGLGAGFSRELTGIVVVTLVLCIALQDLTAVPIGRRVGQRA